MPSELEMFTTGSAGIDLWVTAPVKIPGGRLRVVDTHLTGRALFEGLPEDVYGLVLPRSGITKDGLIVVPGVIDRDYEGVIMVSLWSLPGIDRMVNHGTRIGQVVLHQFVRPPGARVHNTVRGSRGFGSTGRY